MPKAKSTNPRKPREAAKVEQVLRKSGFERVDCFRPDRFVLRVRVVDDRFEGLDRVEREELVNPVLRKLPESIQADILTVLLLAPSEESHSWTNMEFEQSMVGGKRVSA